jgi:hypothetical protein
VSTRKRTKVAQLARRFGTGELARRVGVSESTVRRWARDGTPRIRHEDLRAVERRSEAARTAARVRIERQAIAEAPRRPPPRKPPRREPEPRYEPAPAPRRIELSPREQKQVAAQRKLAQKEISRLRAIAKPKKATKPRKPKRPKPPPPDLDVLEDEIGEELDEEVVRLEQEIQDEIEAAERLAIQEEERAPKPAPLIEEDEEEAAPAEDVYPLPVRRLDFFREHERTDLEGVTKITFDPETGRIYGIDDQGRKVAAYLFTNEDGQPKQGPDSLRWALAKNLEGYVAEVNRAIRERYGNSTMRGAFGRFTQPGRAA